MRNTCPIGRKSCSNCMYNLDVCSHPSIVGDTYEVLSNIARRANIHPNKLQEEIKRYTSRIENILLLDKYLEFLRDRIKPYEVNSKVLKIIKESVLHKSWVALPEFKIQPYLICEALQASNFRQFCKLYSLNILLEDVVNIDFSTAQRIRLANKPDKR